MEETHQTPQNKEWAKNSSCQNLRLPSLGGYHRAFEAKSNKCKFIFPAEKYPIPGLLAWFSTQKNK